MFDPDSHMPRMNRGMVYLGACLIAGIRLARERQVNVRVVPTGKAIEESVDLAYEIFNRVFRRVPERMQDKFLANARAAHRYAMSRRLATQHWRKGFTTVNRSGHEYRDSRHRGSQSSTPIPRHRYTRLHAPRLRQLPVP